FATRRSSDLALGNPDWYVVAQRFAHQGELGLVFAAHRNTRRVDLGEAWVREVCPLAMGSPCGCHVASHGVCGQIKDIAIAAGGEHYCVCEVSLDPPGHHVAGDHAA